jgi:acetolactate synthase-1/2/3 large subunit
MATAAQLIAKRLAEAGCRHVFGVPGGEVLTLMEALRAEGIEFVLAKHENNAGFMAEGAWHATGAPPVLLTTIGPGVANAVNVAGNARLDRVPLIFISGAVDAQERQTYTHQVVDHGAMLRPVVKASFEVVPGAADVIIDKAVSIAMDSPPGPVHIDLPVGVAAQEEPAAPLIRRPKPIPTRPAGSEELVSARHLLSGAQRPLIIAGVEALDSKDAPDMLTALALDFSIPVITTYKAKGVYPEDDFLSLGSAGLSPIADAARLDRAVGRDGEAGHRVHRRPEHPLRPHGECQFHRRYRLQPQDAGAEADPEPGALARRRTGAGPPGAGRGLSRRRGLGTGGDRGRGAQAAPG